MARKLTVFFTRHVPSESGFEVIPDGRDFPPTTTIEEAKAKIFKDFGRQSEIDGVPFAKIVSWKFIDYPDREEEKQPIYEERELL